MNSPEGADFVRVLGPVQVVTSSGRAVDLPSTSQRRLLGLLALHARRSVRAEWLADALAVSPGALRTTVSRLRKALGETALQTTTIGYRLDLDVDAEMFCRDIAGEVAGGDRIVVLERALARWRGAALEEFASEEWAAGEVARLAEQHASATEDLAAELIAASRWSDAVARLEAHIAVYPLRDRARGLLIEALAGEGRQADALRAFQQYRTLLAEQVGTEPSAEVRRIEQRVATGWAAVDVEIPLHGALAHGPRLVGRSRERAWLDSDAARAVSSGLRAVVLSGEAGIGKTTLLGAFARDLHDRGDGTVLFARCDDGAAVALQPFRSLVGWCVEHAPTALLEAHAARFGGELLRIAPQFAIRVSVPEPATSDDATDRYLLFEAVADLLQRVAGNRLLVLMLDDLHWAEPTAMALVRHLTRALADAPVLLIASLRDTGEHLSDELRLVLADLDRVDAKRIQLSGFDDAELADLVASLTASGGDATALAARLRDESAGNPLYATQLLRYWVESGRVERRLETIALTAPAPDGEIPPSLRDIVWSRVGALGATTSAVLSAGAVLGTEFSEDVLPEMVDVPESDVEGALDTAVAAGLLLPIDTATRTMRFAHALVANALYSELQPVWRRRLHERAARALGKSADELPQKVVVQLARHCALGGLLPDAQRWATAAGDHAFAHLAPSEAAAWYRAALEHCTVLERPDAERADLVVRLGDALHRAGDPAALATLRDGAELAKQCGAAEVLVRAALATDSGFMRVGTFAPAQLAIVESAVAVCDPEDVTTYARLLALYAQSLIHTSRTQDRQDAARHALDLATNSSDPTLLPRIGAAVLYALWGPGASTLRADVAKRAVAAAEASDDPVLEFATHTAAYTVAIELADPVAAARSLERLRAIVAHIGAPRMRWTLGIDETFEATMAARLDDAERIAGETLEIGMQIGEPDAFALYAMQFFVMGTFAGRHAELFAIVEQAASEAPLLALRLAYAVISAAVGEEDTARAVLAEGVASGFTHIPPDAIWITSVIGYAVLAIELGDANAAAQLFPIIEPFAAEVSFNGATSHGPIAAYLGKLASLLGRHDVADAYLADALDTAAAFGWEYHRATTLIALAQSRLRRTGALDAEARAWLTEADTICATRGLGGWAIQIEALRAEAPVTRD